MPRLHKYTTPRSKLLERSAFRNGWRKKMFFLNGDSYTGEWKDDVMHGKGKYFYSSGLIYEGDFVNNRRHGYGILTAVKDGGKCDKIYVGQWKYDTPDGKGEWYMPKTRLVFNSNDDFFKKRKTNDPTDFLRPDFDKIYYFKCVDGKPQRQIKPLKLSATGMALKEKNGVPGGVYKGDFARGQRTSWGHMKYPDGSFYFGDWLLDERNGIGLMVNALGNRYEGEWLDNKKSGPGEYHHINTGQFQKGVWYEDIAKVTEMVDACRNSVPKPTPFPLPHLELLNPNDVLSSNAKELLQDHRLHCPICINYEWEMKYTYKPPKQSPLQKALQGSCM